MHNAALQALGIPCTYTRLHIHPDQLSEALKRLPQLGFLGFNLTIPHKAAALPLLDAIDPRASRLGVVNTVIVRDRLLHGFNTDGEGLARAVQSHFQRPLGSHRVLVIGAGGGAGRAIAIQCALAGCPEITLANRTAAKLEPLAAELRKVSAEWHPESPAHVTTCSLDEASLEPPSAECTLLLQCSSLGMSPGDPSPFPARLLQPHHHVYDTIYSQHTQLLRNASTAGIPHANGLSMLLHQGALAFEIWFQTPAPISVMEQALRQSLSLPTP
jgi:shikimate dehydrogenase